uniref:Uncharacterized protein n=1 Tax=Anas platyrhynchos TaxID=8839 RepID=A0A8B9SGA1_ANAPL
KLHMQIMAKSFNAEKQGKPKALVARVSLKQGYTGKSERTDDRTGGKIAVDLSGRTQQVAAEQAAVFQSVQQVSADRRKILGLFV